jgi:ankyrin repeat protein
VCLLNASLRRARSRDVFGLQPLHKAVGHGHLKVAARLLADGGVDSNSRCVHCNARGWELCNLRLRLCDPAERWLLGGTAASTTRDCVSPSVAAGVGR